MYNFNDVTDAFDGWLQSLTGTRYAGAYTDGRWSDSGSGISFSGVVQNANAKDLKVLPEGLRFSESIKIHTEFELVPQIGDTNTGDTVSYNGQAWLVHWVADRKIGGYFKAIAIRQ